MILRAYRVELDPNDRQRTAFIRHAGSVRFVYNWGLATLMQDYAERKAATPEGEKVKGGLRPLDLQARLPALKIEHPWLAEVTAQSLQMSVRNLDRAFRGFFRRVKAGLTPGYPRFKKRGLTKPAFQFAQKVKATGTRVCLPKIGPVRLKQRGYIPADLPLKTVTVREVVGRWFVTVLVEVPDPPKVETTGGIIGIDLGVKTLATLSDGTVYPNPKHLERSQDSLTRLQRKLSRQQKGSNRRAKTKVRIAKAHARISNQRVGSLHKMTSEVVKTKRPTTIVIEDLNVAGMTRNRRLARAVSSASFAEIRRQLTYKCDWHGVKLVVADRFYPSSKTCNGCGAVKSDITLGERTYVCDLCGYVRDRDVNAALNLRGWGMNFLAGGTPATARGGNVRPEAIRADSVETRTDQGTAP
jgi:putative transposase